MEILSIVFITIILISIVSYLIIGSWLDWLFGVKEKSKMMNNETTLFETKNNQKVV